MNLCFAVLALEVTGVTSTIVTRLHRRESGFALWTGKDHGDSNSILVLGRIRPLQFGASTHYSSGQESAIESQAIRRGLGKNLDFGRVRVRSMARKLSPSRQAAFMISRSMAKSIRDSKKSMPKIGRPKTTGSGQPQVVRMHDRQIAAIDAWTVMQDVEISRPEAIRRLVEIGLKAKR